MPAKGRMRRTELEFIVSEPKDNLLLNELYSISDVLNEMIKQLYEINRQLGFNQEMLFEDPPESRYQFKVEECRQILMTARRNLFDGLDSACEIFSRKSEVNYEARQQLEERKSNGT